MEDKNYSKAIFYAIKSCEVLERHLSNNDLELTYSYSNISRIYADSGDYQSALEWSYKALKIRERVLSPYSLNLYYNYK
ncbi:MAG: tetratricopeptide repeat protein [Saprospiraceae bacterium]|nr:tetratricopeptide repeat protein [Saprospiraceae bacterium]